MDKINKTDEELKYCYKQPWHKNALSKTLIFNKKVR